MFGIKQVNLTAHDSAAHFVDQSDKSHRIKGVITFGERFTAGLIGLVLLAMLVVGAALRPAPEGHGTHQQMGLPPCGFYLATGTPCPTCGMTTAFAHVANRAPVAGFVTQPFGAALALVASVGFWGCAHVALFGSRLGRVLGKLMGSRAVLITAGVWLASWVYTIITWRA